MVIVGQIVMTSFFVFVLSLFMGVMNTITFDKRWVDRTAMMLSAVSAPVLLSSAIMYAVMYWLEAQGANL